MSKWVLTPAQPVVPDWVWNPREKILSTVWEAVVGGLETATETMGGAILGVYRGAIIAPAEAAGGSVQAAFAEAGASIIAVERSLNATFIQIGMSSGLAAPFTVALLFTFSVVFTGAALFGLRAVVGVIDPR